MKAESGRSALKLSSAPDTDALSVRTTWLEVSGSPGATASAGSKWFKGLTTVC